MGVFNAFTGSTLDDKSRLTVGPDSFADVSIISPNKVDPSWDTVNMPPIGISGVGGGKAAPLTTAVKIPLQLQWGAPVCHVYAYVGAAPRNVDILMGCDIIDFLELKRKSTVQRAA